MRRGDIWWAELDEPRGSEPGFKRPVLIIQADDFNRSRIQTVLAIVLSSNLRLAEAPGNVLLEKKHTGLSKDSTANVSQVLTLDKAYLTEKVGELPTKLLHQMDSGLKLVLGLT